MAYAVETDGLLKSYGDVAALRGVTLRVPSGRLFGIIGADGAGKTTLLRICTTLITQDKGSASVLSLDNRNDFRKIRREIGYMPQKFSLYEDLSVKENMQFFADVFGVSKKERSERVTRLLSFSRLGPFQNRRAQNLSGGMKQKLALSCALIHTPRLLILDEPTTGVDPVSRTEFWNILHDLRNQGITIIISTPYMEEAEYCNEVLLLHKGSALLQGTPQELCDAYPLTLFRISSAGGSLTFPANRPAPQGIRMLYPVGGALHAVCEHASATGDEILNLVQEEVPQATDCEPVRPRMEDVVFYYLSEETINEQYEPQRR